ncbi:hypothetical protein ACOTWK_04825 [Aliarcobacter butzleri]|uniref:hypothetical protein n=1 Tax=Aliarcobacter butzleri TaxID=28197 RepID=UPI001EDAD58D|nr:hypothetical protein [Aliarcobacter butzleri]MCG3655890.1 hypothetical protein [Aliarcobacter butzleri]MDK2050915.1 hypothetical protein [Aliarcobacter butzleri]
MKKDLNVIKAFNVEVSEENIIALRKNHDYISDKLILDAINGVSVVAKDHNEVLKSRQSIVTRALGGITGSSKKHQDMINENLIEGINACIKWLQDHDRHLTRIDKRIFDITSEIENTQEQILKFYSQHTKLKNRVGELENSFVQFVDTSKNVFNNFEERILHLEVKSKIDKEISLLKSGKKYEKLVLPLKVYSLMDNLFSGEVGLYFNTNLKNNDENILHLESELINVVKSEVGSNHKNELIRFDDILENIGKLDSLEKDTLSFISTQHYNQMINSRKYPEICDFISIASSYDFENAKKEIKKQSNISEFLTHEDFISIVLKEQLIA